MAKYIGIKFRRNEEAPIARVVILEKESGAAIYDTSMDLYIPNDVDLPHESFTWWYKLPNPNIQYEIIIRNNGLGQALAGGNLQVDGYYIQEDCEPANPTTAMLLLWKEGAETIHLFNDITLGAKTEITKVQSFTANGAQTIFTLSGENMASAIHSFSDDGGATWKSPYDLSIVFGSNPPNFDDELVGDAFYPSIRFFIPPPAGSVIQIKYVPKATNARLLMAFNLPQTEDGSYVDLKTPARMLDYSLELFR